MAPKSKDDIQRDADDLADFENGTRLVKEQRAQKLIDRISKYGGDYPADAIKVLDGIEPRVHEPSPEEVTCLKCGWVSFAVTKADALKEIEKFNGWYRKQPEDVKARYGQESSLDQYRCLRCKGTEFRRSKPGDAPRGVTLNPVVWEPGGED